MDKSVEKAATQIAQNIAELSDKANVGVESVMDLSAKAAGQFLMLERFSCVMWLFLMVGAVWLCRRVWLYDEKEEAEYNKSKGEGDKDHDSTGALVIVLGSAVFSVFAFFKFSALIPAFIAPDLYLVQHFLESIR